MAAAKDSPIHMPAQAAAPMRQYAVATAHVEGAVDGLESGDVAAAVAGEAASPSMALFPGPVAAAGS